MMHSRKDASTPYITLDGSEIRELMRPQPQNACQNQSLAEAIVRPGGATRLHRHLRSEELYRILSGSGLMTLADETFAVMPGDTMNLPANCYAHIKQRAKAKERIKTVRQSFPSDGEPPELSLRP